MLSEEELVKLELHCHEYARTFRAAYPDRNGLMTPKGHLLADHVPILARRFGTCGVFGEDGIESLHPLDTAARMITRSMRDPVARARATEIHRTLLQGSNKRKKGEA